MTLGCPICCWWQKWGGGHGCDDGSRMMPARGLCWTERRQLRPFLMKLSAGPPGHREQTGQKIISLNKESKVWWSEGLGDSSAALEKSGEQTTAQTGSARWSTPHPTPCRGFPAALRPGQQTVLSLSSVPGTELLRRIKTGDTSLLSRSSV